MDKMDGQGKNPHGSEVAPALGENQRLLTMFGESRDSLPEMLFGMKQLIHNIPVGVIVKDLSLKYLYANPAFVNYLGCEAGEIVGKTAAELFSQTMAEDLTRIDRLLLAADTSDDSDAGVQGSLVLVTGEWPHRVRVTKKTILNAEGATVGIQTTFQPCEKPEERMEDFGLTGKCRVSGNAESGSESTESPEEREYAASPNGEPRIQLNRYVLAARVRKIGIWEYWPDEDQFYPDSVYCSLIGYSYREFSKIPGGWFSVIPSDYVKTFRATLADLMSGKVDRLEIEHSVIKRGGLICWLSMSAALIREDGRWKLIGASIDITDRKLEEEKHRRLITAIEHAADSIMIVDTGGCIRVVNPAFERMTGYSSQEVIGENPRLLSSDKMDKQIYHDMWRTITGGDTWQGRFVNRRKNGDVYHAITTISPVLDASGWISNYVSIARDVTRDVELEAQMRQFQKMEAVGMLAGGIAHDFNNILYVIRGYTELAQQMSTENSELQDMLEQIGIAERRGAELVGQILAFSRQSERGRKEIYLQRVVKEVIKLLRETMPATIDVHAAIDADCDPILADPTQIFQVIMVICTNAFNALRVLGGRLDVEVREIVLDEILEETGTINQRRLVKVKINDSGPSLNSELLTREFSPGFESGGDDENVDHGLSIVRDIVEAHDGDFEVDAVPGGGTRYEIGFPAIAATVREDEENSLSETVTSAGKRILVVDDEKALTKMLKIILEGAGYHVHTWTDSQQALRAFVEAPDKFDLIITDQTMPRMTGADLSVKILETRSDIPIILCTGFSEMISEEQALALGIRTFLKKPIAIRDLVTEIEKLLVSK